MKKSAPRTAHERPPGRSTSITRLAVIVALAVTGLMVWTQASRITAGPPAGSSDQGDLAPAALDGEPLLIKHGWDIPDISFVASNATTMEQMPFDGVVMQMDDGLSSAVQSQEPVTLDAFRGALAPLAGADLTSMKHNFLMIYSTPAGDIFDNWSTPLSNYTNMARAADEAGLEGIFFDNEEYFGSAVDMDDNCTGDRTADECRAQAFLRGRQVLDAIRSGWPDAEVLIAHGPYIGDAETSDYLEAHDMSFNDVSRTNALRGAFAAGIASATIGTAAQYIDGGQVYSARTVQNFTDLKSWQEQGSLTSGSLVPEDQRSQWATSTSAAFGVYDASTSDPPMNSRAWEATLTNALHVTDRYVWAYTEQHDWWGTGHPNSSVPDSWVAATRQARETTR